MKWLRLGFSLGMTLLLFLYLEFPQQVRPTLRIGIGAFFNPFSGFLQNGTPPLPGDRSLAALDDAATAIWDDRGVPHLFAGRSDDLFFLQGYLTARERLWQMEFLARRAEGRLSEWFGAHPDIVRFDRYRRRVGLARWAEGDLERMLADDTTRAALEAYAAGVNACIEELGLAERPLEYKLLDTPPRAWTPRHSALILKEMAWEASGQSEEIMRTRTRLAIGDSLARVFFDGAPYRLVPTVPDGTPRSWRPRPVPGAPDTLPIVPPIAAVPVPPTIRDHGSNAWVVAANRTAEGAPLLACDPHGPLKMPARFFEIQLHGPRHRAYGVSIPGVPGIWVGFGARHAWARTMGRTDQIDWYRLELRRGRGVWQYRHGTEWRTLTAEPGILRLRGGAVLPDTLFRTDEDRVVFLPDPEERSGETLSATAFQWSGTEPANDLAGLLALNRAASLDDVARTGAAITTPAQNLLAASLDGGIGAWHAGRIPLRWEGQGRYLSSGGDTRFDWERWIPSAHLPAAVNPAQGFLQSANQRPVGMNYPYFLDGGYASYERSSRIAEVLGNLAKATPADMMDLQTDVLNIHARTTLPAMIDGMDPLDLGLAEASDVEFLRDWTLETRRNSQAAVLFEAWWAAVERLLWEDELAVGERGILAPPHDTSVRLMVADTLHPFWRTRRGEGRLSRSDLLVAGLEETHQRLSELLGAYGPDWRWADVRPTTLDHLANYRGLGRDNLVTDGGPWSVNAIRSNHGPLWRLVVQLGTPPRAWAVLPGGQSGHPGASHFGDQLDDWAGGRYHEVVYLTGPDGPASGRVVHRADLRPSRSGEGQP